ncbi:spondin domain-containing protein [Rugamonas rubra]|uniref:Spondin_N n=1 Tax=Rugamonas rubra TaxID=758825 RepID=A0A1I4QDM3_9BURK|nr:spondin domain-containing protein [Rugamonas rubra]SFM38114.1 Spondin_N [Rugamonas rubra]
MRSTYPTRAGLTALAAALMLAACSGGDSAPDTTPPPPAPTTASYEITVVNLTAGQPLSPLVALAHNDGFSLFKVGDGASVALEHLAEGGESAPLAALAKDSQSVYASAVATAGLPPGAGNKAVLTLTVPLAALPTLRLSLASMLGNSNDGFTGVSAQSLATLAIGATVDTRLLGYDAGTERNTESADSVPGPATANSGGKREAFNAARDDAVNHVHLHPGIVSKDDGLPTSALTQAQRWDNPVALLSVKRTQ